MNTLKETVKAQLAGKQYTLLAILLGINAFNILVRFMSVAFMGTTSVTAQFASSALSFVIAFLNGAIWFVFLQVAKNKSYAVKDLNITFPKVLYLILCSFIVEFLVLGITYGLVLLMTMIPFASILVLFITPFISILVIPLNGMIAFQIAEGSVKVFQTVRNALSWVKMSVRPCISAVLPYFVWIMVFAMLQQSIYYNIFLDSSVTSIYNVFDLLLQGSTGWTNFGICFGLEILSLLGSCYFLVRTYTTIANLYLQIKEGTM
ncbi:MAG: hypothetical protein ACRCZJ_07600 [Erysipelotrichaceae bacterium]